MTINAEASETPNIEITEIRSKIRKSGFLNMGILAAIFCYLAYAWFAFGVSDLIARAQPERATLLATDSVAYKVHVTKSLRTMETEIAIEGERTATYKTEPEWVSREGERYEVDLGEGLNAVIVDSRVEFNVPDYGTIRVRADKSGVHTDLPDGPVPSWIRVTKNKFDARPSLTQRVQVSKARIEVHRYFFGWENFFFPFNSDLYDLTTGELLHLVFSAPRLQEDQANWLYVFDTFWRNPDWQHGNVFVALLETLLMAVLGTFTAAFVGLPLAILAARNFTPTGTVRFFVRRLFDFVRGIDMLIWSLIFIRAFGLGPLTGALAIAFTDTGSLGKLFSEALENVDKKQIEGVRSTGASRLQLYRFGVIPQILPILVSQTLYYLESNTRSATVIGALGAGGIGLMLVETMRTSRDWENTFYIIILTIILVMAMDRFSSWLRRRLIEGKEQ